MLSEEKRDLVRDKGTKLGRILIGFLFFMSGVGIVMGGPANTAAWFASLGIPAASLMVWLVIVLKLGAGSAIMFGQRVGLASALLIGFTIIATLLAHMDFSDPMQLTQALKNLAIIGGLLYLMAYGSGGSNTRLAPSNQA
jgi:putative oxidoreductase